MNPKKKLKKSISHGVTLQETAESEFPLTSLPDEILKIVFSHLEVNYRLRLCLVCKKWMEIINCLSLLSDITLKIRSSTFEDYTYPCVTRNFLNVELLSMSADDHWINGIKCISPNVEYLTIRTYGVEVNIIFSHDMKFENLETLDILNCTAFHGFPSCPNLSTLLLYSDTFTDAFIAILQKTMKRLSVFILYSSFVDDPSIYRKYYPPGVTYDENPSSEVLSIFSIKSFISERDSTLTEIYLNNTLALSTLTELLCVKGLNLTHLSLYMVESNWTECSKFFVDLFRIHRNLKTLNLTGWVNLNDDANGVFSKFIPNIEQLRIRCQISDKCLKDVFNLKKLKKLVILNYSNSITPSGCREAISNFKPIQLKHLMLYSFALHKDSASFIKEWTHLVKLDLTRCLVTDSHVHVISTYLVNLEELNLSENGGITDNGLNAVLDPEENQYSILYDNITGYKALHNLKRLRKLDLSMCTKLTDDGVIAAVRLPFLRYLILYRLNLADTTYSVLRSQNPYMQRLGTRMDRF